jgi:hypothetical protein
MNSIRWHAVAAFLTIVAGAQAQQFTPHVGYVYPAGGRQGSKFEVTVGGQFLDGVNGVLISGRGVEAKIVHYEKPLTQGQFNRLRDQLLELTDKKAFSEGRRVVRNGEDVKPPAVKPKWTDEDEKQVAELRKKLATFIRRPTNPAIAEIVVVQVTLTADAPLDGRELRLVTPSGLTNPLAFCVNQLPEFSKPAAKASSEVAKGKGAKYRDKNRNTTVDADMKIELPAVVNGQALPGGIDRFRFQAAKGTHLVIAASARELIPYISDAVPGWFQATLALYDGAGKEVQYSDHFRFHPDPVLYYEIPGDGEYTLEVRDSIYRGREDFVYRIALGELPFITSIYPLGGRAGAKTNVELKGWNLPVTKLKEQPKKTETGILQASVKKGAQSSNRVGFVVESLPEKQEKEPNNEPKNAERVKLPIIVNGRIDKPGDQDVFRFEGRAGEEIVAEVMARRLDSPLDSILRLTDSAGKQLAVNDDCDDKGSGLLTHHADSRISFKLPANGTYYVQIADAQRKGGPEYGYRLRLTHPQPDFELRIVPASLTARAGSSVPITVYALRKDGFDGDIALKLKDAPRGYTLNGGWIPGNQDKVRLTLTVPPSKVDKPFALHLDGHATVQGKEVVHAGVPAEDMMQAFAYRHLVPSKDWIVRVTPPSKASIPWKLAAADKPVKLPMGGTAPVRLLMPAGNAGRARGGNAGAGSFQLTLNEPPEGIAIKDMVRDQDGLAILLTMDAKKLKPGMKGNLIMEASVERSTGTATKNNTRRQVFATLPAIPFEVVKP